MIVYFVHSGMVKIIDQSNEERTLAYYASGQLFGVLEVVCSLPRLGTAIALQKTTLFTM